MMQTSGPPNKPYRRKVARRNAPLQSYNWVFIHIPKTGGTSIRSALGMGPRPYHVTAKAMWQKYPEWTSKFAFAFVRNPWDRLVSWVHRTSAITWPPDRFDQLGLEPQVDYILDENGKPLVNFIGRFESLADDFNTICGHLGIATPELHHLNRSEHRHYRECYDETAMQFVTDNYAEDIERFGYSF